MYCTGELSEGTKTNPYPSHINEFGAIFGEYFIQYSDLAKNLTNFSHPDQATALLALVDEVVPSKSDQVEALTRQLITDNYIKSEKKYETEEKVKNYQGIMLASNNKHAISLSEQSRRYVIFDCINTKPARDPLHRTYMHYKLADLKREDGVHTKALQGFFLDPQIWNDKNAFGDVYDDFKDGSGIPPSIDINLGTQRAFQQDSVTGFWLTCLDRGYVISPEHNPLHPCNLKDARDVQKNQTGLAYYNYIQKFSPIGYREGIDYKILDDKYQTPYHDVGNLWACFLLEDTVYDAYRTHFFKMKSRGGGFNPESEGKFWSRTYDIFPVVARNSVKMKQIKLIIPQEAFLKATLRTKEHVTGETETNGDGILREKVNSVPKTVVNTPYYPIMLMELKDMREQFKQNTGRLDLVFTSTSCEMFTMTKLKPDSDTARSEQNLYTKPFTGFLKQFGFNEQELLNLYGEFADSTQSLDNNLVSVFGQLSGYDGKMVPVVNKYDASVTSFVQNIQTLNKTPTIDSFMDTTT